MSNDPSAPLRPADHLILLALTGRPRHGYGILQDLEELSEGDLRLDPGNLYRRLRRLLDAGWVERSDDPPSDEDTPSQDERRRYYHLTDLGREVATAETRRLRRVVDSPAARMLMARSGRRGSDS